MEPADISYLLGPISNDYRPFFNGPELLPATWYATWDRPGASLLDLILSARSVVFSLTHIGLSSKWPIWARNPLRSAIERALSARPVPVFRCNCPHWCPGQLHSALHCPYSRIRSSTDPNGRPWPWAESGPNEAIGRNRQNGSSDPTNGHRSG